MANPPKTETKVTPNRSPEQLDSALSIVSSHAWVWLAAIGLILLAIIIWAFLARLNYRSDGLGIILKENSVLYDVTAPYEGIVSAVQVKVGQKVEVGDLLAEIRFPQKESDLKATEKLLKQTRAQLDTQSSFAEVDLPRRERDKNKKIASLEKSLNADHQLLDFLTALAKTQKAELKAGYITRQQQESTLNQLHSTEESIRSTKNEIRSLNTSYSEQANATTQKTQQLQQQLTQTRGKREQIRVTLEQGRYILSPVAGVITEIDVNAGQRIPNGAQVAVVEESGEGLHVVAYFKNSQGKKLAPGMSANVSPTSVERNIYGTIEAQVVAVSPVPDTEDAVTRILGNRDLAKQLSQGGAPISATLLLTANPKSYSGFEWTSSTGPDQKITPGTSASVEVIVRRIRPIDLVVPLYETWIASDTPDARTPVVPVTDSTSPKPERTSDPTTSKAPASDPAEKTAETKPSPQAKSTFAESPEVESAASQKETSAAGQVASAAAPGQDEKSTPNFFNEASTRPSRRRQDAQKEQSSPPSGPSIPQAEELVDIETAIFNDGIIIHLKGRNTLPFPRRFTLGQPDRLVLDFPSIQNGLEQDEVLIQSPHLERIRIGNHPDKLRLVLDQPGLGAPLSSAQLLRAPGGLLVVLGNSPHIQRAIERRRRIVPVDEEWRASVRPTWQGAAEENPDATNPSASTSGGAGAADANQKDR